MLSLLNNQMETDISTSILKNRGFLNLWINQILVQLSYNALNFGLLVWVYRLTGSSAAVSLMLFSVYLPSVVFGLFAGILVDITDRKKIITIINLLLALCFLSLIFLKGSFIAILFIVFLVNSLVQFYVPAESSAIPLICSRKQLLAANSLFAITLFGAFLGGFGIAGPLINFFGINFVFIFGAILLLIAFFLSFLFPPINNSLDPLGKKLSEAIQRKNASLIVDVAGREIKNTFSLIKGRVAVLVSLFILASIQVAIAVLGTLVPSFFEGVLKINAADASFIMIIPLGLGMVLGGVILSRFGSLIPKRTLVAGGITVGGILFFILGTSYFIGPIFGSPANIPEPFIHKPIVTTALMLGSFLLGLAMVGIVVPSQTALQEYSPERDRGKVYAALSVLMSFLTLVPVLLVGVLADLIGASPIFLAMGAVIALTGLLAFKPDFYFSKKQLPYKVRQFLGLGHWKKHNETS